MAIATAMYHTQRNPLKKVTRDSQSSAAVETVRASRMRKLHKAFLRYHDPENWPLLRDALRQMGRADLIGSGKKHLIPGFQPVGTGMLHRCGKAAAVKGWNSKPEKRSTKTPRTPRGPK